MRRFVGHKSSRSKVEGAKVVIEKRKTSSGKRSIYCEVVIVVLMCCIGKLLSEPRASVKLEILHRVTQPTKYLRQ